MSRRSSWAVMHRTAPYRTTRQNRGNSQLGLDVMSHTNAVPQLAAILGQRPMVSIITRGKFYEVHDQLVNLISHFLNPSRIKKKKKKKLNKALTHMDPGSCSFNLLGHNTFCMSKRTVKYSDTHTAAVPSSFFFFKGRSSNLLRHDTFCACTNV